MMSDNEFRAVASRIFEPTTYEKSHGNKDLQVAFKHQSIIGKYNHIAKDVFIEKMLEVYPQENGRFLVRIKNNRNY